MPFYYDRDKYGNEHCGYCESIQKDASEKLFNSMSDDASNSVGIVHYGDFWGYKTLDEYYQNECQVDCDATAVAIYEAIVNCKSPYPLALVRHADGEYECMSPDDVDYFGLLQEYTDWGAYKVQPIYFEDKEYTPETARKAGMYALADELERWESYING